MILYKTGSGNNKWLINISELEESFGEDYTTLLLLEIPCFYPLLPNDCIQGKKQSVSTVHTRKLPKVLGYIQTVRQWLGGKWATLHRTGVHKCHVWPWILENIMPDPVADLVEDINTDIDNEDSEAENDNDDELDDDVDNEEEVGDDVILNLLGQ